MIFSFVGSFHYYLLLIAIILWGEATLIILPEQWDLSFGWKSILSVREESKGRGGDGFLIRMEVKIMWKKN